MQMRMMPQRLIPRVQHRQQADLGAKMSWVCRNRAQRLRGGVLGVALGSVVIGLLSDRLRNRRDVMIAYTFLYAFSWLPWILHVPLPLWASYGWCLLMGLVVPGFVLTWTIAKEANRPEHAGMAISVVNVGIFLGAGVLQPLVGAVLDAGRHRGDIAGAWDHAIWLLAASAALGAVCTLFVRKSDRSR
jgi:predicted MFS family arabinose efflux permease